MTDTIQWHTGKHELLLVKSIKTQSNLIEGKLNLYLMIKYDISAVK